MDTSNINMKGNVRITNSQGLTLLNEQNHINEAQALEIVLMSLSKFEPTASIDHITVYGDFGSRDVEIKESSTNVPQKFTNFKTVLTENLFEGEIHKLELKNGQDKVLAIKEGLNITKDGQSSLVVDWTISINIC